MTGQKLTSRIRIVYKRSSRLTKIAVCATIVVSVATLLVIRSKTLAFQQEEQSHRDQAQQLEQEHSQLEDKIGNVGSQAGLEEIAKEELGLVNPDSVVLE